MSVMRSHSALPDTRKVPNPLTASLTAQHRIGLLAVFLTATLTATGCSQDTDGAAPSVQADPVAAAPTSIDPAQDGAAAIAVYEAFNRTVRAGDFRAACEFTTETLLDDPEDPDGTGCAKALSAPSAASSIAIAAKVDLYTLVASTPDEAVLRVSFRNAEPVQVTIVRHRSRWLLDGSEPAPDLDPTQPPAPSPSATGNPTLTPAPLLGEPAITMAPSATPVDANDNQD